MVWLGQRISIVSQPLARPLFLAELRAGGFFMLKTSGPAPAWLGFVSHARALRPPDRGVKTPLTIVLVRARCSFAQMRRRRGKTRSNPYARIPLVVKTYGPRMRWKHVPAMALVRKNHQPTQSRIRWGGTNSRNYLPANPVQSTSTLSATDSASRGTIRDVTTASSSGQHARDSKTRWSCPAVEWGLSLGCEARRKIKAGGTAALRIDRVSKRGPEKRVVRGSLVIEYLVTSYLRSFFVKAMPQKYLLSGDGTRESGDELIAWAKEQVAMRRAMPIMVDPSRVSKCGECGADIVWMTTKNGKWCPVTANSITPFDRIFDPRKNECHYPICPEQQETQNGR